MTLGPDDIYLSLDEALAELHTRKQNPELCAFVKEIFGEVPSALNSSRPHAVMARYIGSPTLEFEQFYRKAEASGLAPLLLEFPQDKFVAKNWEKYCLCRPTFAAHTAHGYEKFKEDPIVNFNTNEGKHLNEIMTRDDEPLVTYHHRLLRSFLAGRPLDVEDFSAWFLDNRGKDKWSYYLRYLGLFLSNAILFENFLVNEKEIEFTTEVVLPAYRTLTDIVGYAPLIVRILPKETENDPYWCYYDEAIATFL